MKPNFAKLVEAVGILAIVLSLLFVGMQLIFDRQVAIADQYHNRAELRIATVRSFFENENYIDELVRSYKRGIRPGFWSEEFEEYYETIIQSEGDLAIADMYRRQFRAELVVLGWDNIHYQYEQGLISEEFWQSTRTTIKTAMGNRLARNVYFVRVFRPTFLTVLENIAAEFDSEADT